MAPSKFLRGATTTKPTLLPKGRKGISTRSQNIQDQNLAPIPTRGKRKADISPLKNDKVKRSALGNLTNNVIQLNLDDKKNNVLTKQDNVSKKTAPVLISKNVNTLKGPFAEVCKDIRPHTKILTRAAARNANSFHEPTTTATAAAATTTVVKPKEILEVTKPTTRRISNEFEKTEDSLYMSALDDFASSDSVRFSSGNFEARRSIASVDLKESDSDLSELSIDLCNRLLTPSPLKKPPKQTPDGVVDFDKENWNDPFQVSHYAMDIFDYMKNREAIFPIEDYMEKQVHLSKWMRSLLVDWMVEVQETFELNHETLYLAVKLVDLYLVKVVVMKDKLQLLGAAALFIACKYDERTPPLVEDFLYICDGAYSHNELIKMEMQVLKTMNYDLGIPLSYRFLRRYARCAKIQMPTLTLARYILEMSLMDYSTISLSDSQLAAAALFTALRMNGNNNVWDKTLEYFTGYKLEDFAYIVPVLNSGLQRKPREAIKTIRNKYSHKIFYEVAKTTLLSNEKLFEDTGLIDQTTKL